MQPLTPPPPTFTYRIQVAGRWKSSKGPVPAADNAAKELLSCSSVSVRIEHAKDEDRVIFELCQRIEENLRDSGISCSAHARPLTNGVYSVTIVGRNNG